MSALANAAAAASPVRALSYVEIPAPQPLLERTAAFYVDVLGFQVVPTPGAAATPTAPGVWLQNFGAGLCIHLVSKDLAGGSLTFVSDALQTVAAQLKSLSVAFDTAQAAVDKEERMIELTTRDPAGNTVTLSARPSPFSSSVLPPASSSSSSHSLPDGIVVVNAGTTEAGVALGGAVRTVPRSLDDAEAPRGDKTVLVAQPRKRIAVLTSGGDSAGMNAALRAIVRTGIYRQCQVYAVHEGYQGMVDGGDDNIRLMSWQEVAGILADGGTIIGTARCKEMRTREGRAKAVYNLVSRGIDAIIVIGGDGSLTGANILRQEWPELLQDLVKAGKLTAEKAAQHPVFAVVGLVGSIDNDMNGTSLTIGADTALHRAVEAVDSLTSTAASHQRCFVVEIMGRNCGWLALNTALACGADWLLIPESPSMRDDWEVEMCDALHNHKETGKRKLMVMVSEGAVDKNGKPIKSEYVRGVIEDRVKIETRVTILGHVQRGGKPSSFDRVAPTLQGVDAVNAVLEMTPETPAPMIGFNHNQVTRLPLVQCVEDTQAVGKAMAAKDFAKALRLRGNEFVEAESTFKKIAHAAPASYEDQRDRVRIAVVHVGAPAGGVNAATRTLVRLGISRGYTVLGVHNSFEGLIAGEVEEISWMGVDNWSMKGGSELGTNRSTPSDDLGMVAFSLQKFNVHGLVIIGGFEGFTAVRELMESRSKYPQFCIPIIHLPATISNNVPGSELALGADTALNIVIEAIDELKQSASSSKRRVFVVETMGGQCGFLATLASLGGGATRCYIPEDGISFDDLAEDLDQLKRKFKDHRGIGRVIVRCENSSPTYTIDFISALLNEEGKKCGLFDARTCNLGHLQQGGTPSPLDRVRGVRLASRCLDFLEKHIEASLARKPAAFNDVHAPGNISVYTSAPETVCVIGYIADGIEVTPVNDLLPSTDMKLRRPKVQFWRGMTPLLRMLTGYD